MDSRWVDLTGERNEMVIIISKSEVPGPRGARLWNCVCDCGKSVVRTTYQFRRTKSCGCIRQSKVKFQMGLLPNGIELLEVIGKNNYNCYMYKAKCHCGVEFMVEGNDARSDRIKSCGCRSNAKLGFEDRGIAAGNNVYARIKASAKKRDYVFDLTKQEVYTLIGQNCFYCDSPPSNTTKLYHSKEIFKFNGIDRIDNEIGYTLENSRTACYMCNQAKHALTEKAFLEMAHKIVDNMKRK